MLKIKSEFILREIMGSYIVVPTGEKLVDFKVMITLNETSAFLWNLLNDEKTFDELVDELISEYDVDIETAKADVKEFIELLNDKKVFE